MPNTVIYTDPEAEKIKKAIARAKALREAGMEPRSMGQYVGRVFVGNNSGLSALGQAVQAGLGAWQERKAEDELAALETQREKQAHEAIRSMPSMYEEIEVPAPAAPAPQPAPAAPRPAQTFPAQDNAAIMEQSLNPNLNIDKLRADNMFNAHVQASQETPMQTATPSVVPGEYDLPGFTADAPAAEAQPAPADPLQNLPPQQQEAVAQAVADAPTPVEKRRVLKEARRYAEEMNQYYANLATIKHPLAQSLATTGLSKMADMPEKLATNEAKYAERREELDAKYAAQREAATQTAKDKAELATMLAKINNEARLEIAKLNSETRRDVAAQNNATRRDIAAQNNALRRDVAGSKGAGKGSAGNVDNAETLIDQMVLDFGSLKEKGGITSSKDNTTLENVGAWAASTGVGQTAGRMFGTQEQSLRNQIISDTRRLATAVKNATGMTAQEMNSNVELQTMLNSLANLEGDYESNITILNRLRDFISNYKKPGSGGSPAAPAAPAAPAGQPGKTVTRRVKLKDGRTGVEWSDGSRTVE